jgi:hypothetical protein
MLSEGDGDLRKMTDIVMVIQLGEMVGASSISLL